MNTIVVTLCKIILTIAILGPIVEWLLNNAPDLGILLVLVAGIVWYIFWIHVKFQKLENKFDTKIHDVEVKFDKKFVESDLHVVKIDLHLENFETRLDQHQVAIETLDKKVTVLQEDVAKVNLRLAVADTKVDNLKVSLEEKIASLDTKQDKRFDRIENMMLVLLEANRRTFGHNFGPRLNQE